jgi:phosphoglycerate dehydrogenase-like enzyme
MSGPTPILAHFGGVTDGMLQLLRASVLDAEFVACTPDGTPPPTDSEILVALAYDAGGTERALVPSVRWIHLLGAGADGFPLEAVGERTLTCSRGASAPAIAEFVLAVMLAFEKQLPQSWITEPPQRRSLVRLGGLRGRTVGIVGLGAIGTEVARLTLAFDMRVLGLRRTAAPSPVPGVEMAAGLDELLARSDHVVVAAPATTATRHLIDAAAFDAIKPGAHLVNVARGALVDQDALLAALDSGRVATASLDVVDPEPLAEGHPLYSHPRVRLSPHISWSAPDTMQRTIALFAENLRRYRAGQPLQGVVDLIAGY